MTRENLEVREEVLGTQMDDEGSDGPRLVEGIVDEETPCGERTEALPAELQGWETFNERELGANVHANTHLINVQHKGFRHQ